MKTVPTDHPLAIEHPSRGKLPQAEAKRLDAYLADVATFIADIESLTAERNNLLAEGWLQTVSDVCDAGDELNRRKAELNARFIALRKRQVALAAELVPAYEAIEASEKERAATVRANVERDLRAAGVCELSFAESVGGGTPEHKFQRHVDLHEITLAAKAQAQAARDDANTIRNLGAAAVNAKTEFLRWPAATGDTGIIADLAGVNRTATEYERLRAANFSETPTKVAGPRPPVFAGGKRPVSWSQNAAFDSVE